ncbi:MAG: CHAT domain-containing protein [Deltaproteobacteria bacterium]|nr:CHAT domain-containing protein [Deltaproteobacteria bacterium]
MDEKKQCEIARMSWTDLANNLQIPEKGKRGAGGVSQDKALREYFGDEEYAYLQKLATRTRAARTRSPAEGNIVLVPGIMGSSLMTTDTEGDADLIWISLFRLVAGQIRRLAFKPDGASEDNSRYVVTPGELDKRVYTRAVLWLQASWNVESFPFDWRKDIDTASDALAVFIKQKFPHQPVHLVAHSMGGLVCRNFIRRHGEQWNALQGGDGAEGGRLIMLGTPNYGSFAIPQTMTGRETLVKLLAAADLKNSLSDILDTINTFVGSYEMLPSPSKLPPSLQRLYKKDSWGRYPVSEKHLDRALQFHRDMEREDTIDPARMTYIAGCNQETLAGMEVVGPGEFDYLVTDNGDGRVTHELGLLPGVPTYYVEEAHGDLPKNEQVLAALQDLLKMGYTDALPIQPVISRSLPSSGIYRINRASEESISRQLGDISLRVKGKKECSPDDVRFAEEALLRAATGQRPSSRPKASKETGKDRFQKQKPLPLHIDVVRGDVTQIKAPVLVVGHYKGAAPVNAEGALDKALDYWITHAGRQGIIGAGLGELFFIPIMEKQVAAKAVVLAGMGNEGEFTKPDLRYLIANAAYAASALKLDTFATVLIGSGTGNLSRERALRGMIEGMADAMQRLPEKQRIQTLILVERNDEAYADIVKSVQLLKEKKVFPNLSLQITSRTMNLPIAGAPQKRPPDILEDAFPETRITVERDRDKFRFSALSKTAVVPVREVEVQSLLAGDIAERLMSSRTPEEQTIYGQMLAAYLMPEDFRRLVEEAESLTLILDRSTASFPWEMAGIKKAQGSSFFGTDLNLTRQFRTMLASPGLMPPLNRSLRVLVIADPAPEEEYRLPGARREGRAVVDVLNRFKKGKGLDIMIDEHIGANACDPVEILALLYNEEYDIVHYAGHGLFDEENPSHGGWVFGKDYILSAREIFQARRVPRLVFANACFSSVIKERQAMGADEMNRSLAGMAEAFFARGIQNYIGAGWPVDDEPAVIFASAFYENALEGKTLGASIAEARRAIFGQASTWGAYQHYGQVNGKLIL